MENMDDNQQKGGKPIHSNPEHREGEDNNDKTASVVKDLANKTNTGEPLVNEKGEELPGPTI